MLGGERGQALADLARRVLRRLAVQVAPVEAAVAEVLATLLVSVAVTRTASRSTPSSCATTCATLVFRPWPISVPPWLTQHRAVHVDVHQRAGLVQVRDVERDAELHRREREAVLQHRAASR